MFKAAVFICKDDDTLCCNECAFLSHRKCDDIDLLGNLTPTVSDNEGLRCSDLKITLDKYDEHATKLIKHEANQCSLVDDSEKDMTKQLTNVRTALDDMCMKIEQKVKRKFEDEKQRLLKGVSVQTEAVDMFQSDVKTVQEEIEMVRKHGTKAHAYLLERSLTQDKMQSLKSEMERLHECATEKVVALTETNVIEELVEPVLNSFQITTSKQEIALPICPVEKSFNERVPVLLGSVNLDDMTFSGRFYPDSCVWLGEYIAAATTRINALKLIGQNIAGSICDHNVLKLIDHRTYTIVDTYKCSSSPWSVAAHENNAVSVCFPEDRTIDIIDIVDGKFKYKFTLKTENNPYCSFYNKTERKTFVLSRNPGTIDMFNTSGEHVGSIPFVSNATEAMKDAYKFTVDHRENILYISSCWENILLAVNMNGKVLFTYQMPNLIHPDGCDIDSEGNVYVCSAYGHSIHQVNKTGEHMQIMLKDELNAPSCISFNSTFDKFVIVDQSAVDHLKFYSFQ